MFKVGQYIHLVDEPTRNFQVTGVNEESNLISAIEFTREADDVQVVRNTYTNIDSTRFRSGKGAEFVIKTFGTEFRQNIKNVLTDAKIKFFCEEDRNGIVLFYVKPSNLTKAQKAIDKFYSQSA